MLIEPSTIPTRVPLPSSINGWVEDSGEWSRSSVRASVVAGWSAIPQPIRDAFTLPFPGTNRGLRIYLGSSQTIYGLATYTSLEWSGLSLSNGVAGDAAPRILGILQSSGDGTDGTPWGLLVHEFGHYVDAAYHRLWGKDLADGSINTLTGTGPLSNLFDEAFKDWTVWQAAAPSSHYLKNLNIYGFHNQLEWFAEIFMFWLVEGGVSSTFYGKRTDALLVLAGMDLSRQQRIHDAIKAFLPVMPPMPGL